MCLSGTLPVEFFLICKPTKVYALVIVRDPGNPGKFYNSRGGKRVWMFHTRNTTRSR